ncbi:MAG: hypothetical protein HYU39_03820 [Thaumarchaeota archaeon]|nr:hypothetical protein [Nitrososphaerota archaeon]
MPSYLVLSKLVVTPEEAVKHREGHVTHLASLKKQGRLEAGYRYTNGTGGFYILNASSMEEAKKLADGDPYHSSKAREYIITEAEKRL